MAYYNGNKVLTVAAGGGGSKMIYTTLADVGYTDPTDNFYPQGFASYCSNFPYGARLVLNSTELYDKNNAPNLLSFLESCPESRDDTVVFNLEIVNGVDSNGNGLIYFIYKFLSSSNKDTCYEYIYEWTKVYPRTPIIESVNIYYTDTWEELSNADPYKYSIDIYFANLTTNTKIVELINDNAVLFANYGFCIGEFNEALGGAKIYALKQPQEDIILKFRLEE